MEVTGSNEGFDYSSDLERADLRSQVSKKAGEYLRCTFTNYGRVPIFTVIFHLTVAYRHGKVITRKHNFPFYAIAPFGTRVVWIVDDDKTAVTIHNPDTVTYVQFPNLDKIEVERLAPVINDYWYIRRDVEPDEQLDESMMKDVEH